MHLETLKVVVVDERVHGRQDELLWRGRSVGLLDTLENACATFGPPGLPRLCWAGPEVFSVFQGARARWAGFWMLLVVAVSYFANGMNVVEVLDKHDSVGFISSQSSSMGCPVHVVEHFKGPCMLLTQVSPEVRNCPSMAEFPPEVERDSALGNINLASASGQCRHPGVVHVGIVGQVLLSQVVSIAVELGSEVQFVISSAIVLVTALPLQARVNWNWQGLQGMQGGTDLRQDVIFRVKSRVGIYGGPRGAFGGDLDHAFIVADAYGCTSDWLSPLVAQLLEVKQKPQA